MSNNNHKTSHHQFATISLGAYPDENVIVDGLNKYKTSNDYNLSTNGFYAEIYINEVSKEINFSFRGTNGIVDVDDDYSLYKQDIPEQFSINSKSYIDQSLSDLGQSYNLSDFTINTTGHSLGGVLSSLSGVYIYSQGYNFGQSVAFDAPATTTNMIQQVAGDNFLTLNPNLQSKFTNYVASPNLVNTTNGDQHYANLVMFEFENQDINPSGFIWIDDYKDFTKDQHSASNFLDKFDPVTGEPINGIPINSWFNLREGYEYFKSYESNKQYWDNYIDSKWNSNPIWHQGSVDGDGSDILRLQDVFKDKESYKELFIKLHLSDLEIDVKEIEVSINNIGGILTNQQKVEIIQEIKTLQNVDLQDKTVTFKNPDGSFEIYRIDGNLINIANQYEVDLNSILISSANNTGFDNLSDREIIADNGGSMYVYRIDEVIKVPNDNRQYNGKIEITHTDNDFDYVSTIPKEQQNEYLYNLFQDVATVKSYIVELGDTLGKIALENNTTIDKILELNNIENIDKIQAGQVIKLNDTEALKKIKLNEDSYNISTKDQEATLKNSGLLAENPEYIDKNGNAISQQEAIFTVEDSNGNINTIQKEGVMTTLKDGTKALLSSVVEMTEKAADVMGNFLGDIVNKNVELLTSSIFDNQELMASIQGEFLARILLGESIEDIATDLSIKLVADQLVNDSTDFLSEITGITVDDGDPNNITGQEFMVSTIKAGLITFGTILASRAAAGETLHSEDYANAAAISLTTAASGQYDFVNHTFKSPPATNADGTPVTGQEGLTASAVANAGIAAAIVSVFTSLTNEASMNSEEYEAAAKEAIVAAAIAMIVTVIVTVIVSFFTLGTMGWAGYAIGAFLGSIIGSAIASVFGETIYDVVNDSWNSSEEVYDGIEDLLKGESFEDNIKQISDGAVDQFKALTIDLTRNIGRDIIDLFSDYGKNLEPGEYWNPYSFLKIVAKEDGSGNIIYGLEKEGVVAMTREYYHDDIYGTTGNDILVGKSGTNLLVGNDGDDMIEGRGDNDQIYGGNGDDIIEAGGGDDYVQGDSGNDLIYGDAGNDVIIGGVGNDIIDGGAGDDQIEGNEGDDIIKGNDGDDVILAGNGNDIVDGGNGNDTILAEDGDDYVEAGEGNDTIEGNAGNDILIGGEGNDNIRGGDGNDEIYGSQGVDMLYGDEGDDIINGGDGDDLIFGGLGNDIIAGGVGNDYIYGEIGNDYLIGGEGNDILDGFDGDDVLFAGKGNDTLDGGRGLDTFIFRNGDGQDTITDTDGTNDVIKFSDINSSQVTLTKDNNNLIITFNDTNGNITTDQITITDQLLNNNIIETLEFADGKKIDLTNISTNSDNTTNYTIEDYYNIDTAIQSGLVQEYSEELDIDARDQVNTDSSWYADNYEDQANKEIENEQYNQVEWRSYKKKRSSFGGHYTVWYKYYEKNLKGTDGNDRIVGNWWSENIYGEGGDDQLYGNNGNDTIYGQDGNDYLNGGADNDTLYGGNGYDKIEGGTGDDTIHGGDQNDALYGQWGNDTIYGNNHDDFINGGEGDDTIEGNNGNDTIFGAAGNDYIYGGGDNDLIIGNEGHDIIEGNEGNDTIYGREGNDIINGNEGDDYISGGEGYDIINGDIGNDILYGDGGVDIIHGDEGNDYIYGGSGNDQLYGDTGNDIIYGGSGSNIIEGGDGNDTITGGEDYDRIEGGNDDDIIFGRSGGDELYGGDGNDIISGGMGNDILIDGIGSENLIGGAGNDIFIITKNDQTVDSDIIEDFNKNEDRIIIKIDYKNPITFATLQSLMSQNGSNTEINFDNGQKIIIKDTNIADLTTDNLAIGLAGGQDNDILFGTNSDDVLFGEGGDDQVYGGLGNDELWGGKGADILYGEDGDDILRYEADDVFEEMTTTIHFDEIGTYKGVYDEQNHYAHVTMFFEQKFIYSPKIGTVIDASYGENDDIFIPNYMVMDREELNLQYEDRLIFQLSYKKGSYSEKYFNGMTGRYDIDLNDALSKDIRPDGSETNLIQWRMRQIYEQSFDRIEYSYNSANKFATKNFYTDETIIINGYNRSFDSFNGGDGTDILLMTEGDDMLSLNDPTSSNPNEGASRLIDISVIYANDGDDIINLTSPKYTHDDLIIYGGNGNDRIWSSIGNDTLFGGSGNDEIYGGDGDDFISGGDGNDVLIGGKGDDIIEGGNGDDQISGNEGDDIIEGGVGADILDGGEGSEIDGDTISYSTSTSGVTINIADNIVSGGDSEGDIISNFENITGSNFVDNLTGDENNNIITGGQGDDILTGGGGSDTYIYNIGDGNDTITDGVNNHGDKITLDASINKDDLIFESSEDGNDLIIKIKGNDTDSLIIKDQLASNGTVSRIEEIFFANDIDSSINLENQTILNNEDEAVEINLDEIEQSRILSQNISFTSDKKGSVIYDENTGIITYKPDQDFNGIEVLTYNITDEEGSVIKTNSINLLSSPVNDNPYGIIENLETIVGIKFKYDIYTFIGSEEEAKQKAKDEKAIIVLKNRDGDETKNKIYHLNDENAVIELDLTLYDNEYLDLLEKLTTLNITEEKSYRPIELGIKSQDFNNLLLAVGYNTQFSINLNDYIKDVDQDDLTYMINVKNQIGLPHWLTLNAETGELSGIFGRDGKITLEVTASDANGGIYQTTFDIKANVDLSQRVIDLPEIEIINGTDFNDRIEAKKDRQDLISTGDGDDEIVYVQDNVWQDTDIISFFAWNVYSGDLVSVNGKQQSFDSFDGGVGNDTLSLTSGNDVLFLDDPITSSLSNSARISGIEIINGGKGDDIIDLSSLNYEYGDVELNGEDGDDVLWSNSGDDTLNGGDGNDNLQGGAGNDVLNGDAGDDVLKGYDGDDILTGGAGQDILTGGFGYDSFDFSFLDDSTINKSDLITDFTQGEDSINFSNFAFMAIAEGEGGNGTIGYNYDEETDITTIADPDSDFALQLSGKIDLTNDDFVF